MFERKSESITASFDAVIMEGVGHFPMLERAEEFNRHLEGSASELC